MTGQIRHSDLNSSYKCVIFCRVIFDTVIYDIVILNIIVLDIVIINPVISRDERLQNPS